MSIFDNPSNIDKVEIINKTEVESRMSKYGNTCCIVDDKAIEELKAGKVWLMDDTEYCHFVKYVPSIKG